MPRGSHGVPRTRAHSLRLQATRRSRVAAHGHGPSLVWRAALLTVSVAASVACPPAPRWWESCARMRGESVAAGVETTNRLVVYLDASAGMRGFISGRGATPKLPSQTVFTRALLALCHVVERVSPPPEVVLRVLGTKVGAPVDESRLRRYATERRRFRGGKAPLGQVFDAFEEPAGDEPRGFEARLPRFHVLLTERAADTHGPGAHSVGEKINRLLSSGWGVTVLGVRSDFDGVVFSEAPRNRPVRHASEPDKPETFRPFYLYIFSPDRGALGALVEALKNELRPLLRSPEQLREYALAVPYVAAAASGELVSTSEATHTVRREERAPEGTLCFDVNVAPAAVRQPPLLARGDDVSCDGARLQPSPPLLFNVRIGWSHHAYDSGTPREVAGLVRWELAPMSPTPERGAVYPEVKILESVVNVDGSVSLRMDARWEEGEGARRTRVYRLAGRLDLEQTAPPWVSAWSAATGAAAQDASRTPHLKVSLGHLWNNQFLQRQEVAAACLRVGV